MGDIYVLYGLKDKGKSSTIKEIYRILSLKYPNYIDIKNTHCIDTIIAKEYEILVEMYKSNIFSNSIKRIGIGSQGDYKTALYETLTKFAEHKCDVIFCAERVSDNILAQLEKLNKKNRNSIIEKTIVGKWVKEWNSNPQNLEYKITPFIPRKEPREKLSYENFYMAKRMIEDAKLCRKK